MIVCRDQDLKIGEVAMWRITLAPRGGKQSGSIYIVVWMFLGEPIICAAGTATGNHPAPLDESVALQLPLRKMPAYWRTSLS